MFRFPVRQENLNLFIDIILEIRFSNTFLCCITPDMFKKSGFRHLEVSHELQNPSFCLLSTVIPHVPSLSSAGCEKTFITFSALFSHNRTHFRETGHFTCTYPGCDKTYDKACRLKIHMRSHTGKEREE